MDGTLQSSDEGVGGVVRLHLSFYSHSSHLMSIEPHVFKECEWRILRFSKPLVLSDVGGSKLELRR
jgi:hypothetical protein